MRLLQDLEIPLKTGSDINGLRTAARLAARAVRTAGRLLRPGVCLRDIDVLVRACVQGRRAESVAVFISVNQVAAHGLPGIASLGDGDIVTVDVSLRLEGWYGDAAWTYLVGSPTPRTVKLARAAWACSTAVLRSARAGARIADLAASALQAAARYGCTVVPQCAGHGIGRELHEEPEIHFTDPGVDGYLAPGMVFTVEPVLTAGIAALAPGTDGISLVTADGAPTAQFEHTVAIRSWGTEVLNLDPAAGYSYDAGEGRHLSSIGRARDL